MKIDLWVLKDAKFFLKESDTIPYLSPTDNIEEAMVFSHYSDAESLYWKIHSIGEYVSPFSGGAMKIQKIRVDVGDPMKIEIL